MKKLLLSLLALGSIASAQTNGKVIQANAADGITFRTNYAQNPNAEANTEGITVSAGTKGRTNVSPGLIKGKQSFSWASGTTNASTMSQVIVGSQNMEGMKLCATTVWYIYEVPGGSGNHFKAYFKNGSNTYGSETTLTPTGDSNIDPGYHRPNKLVLLHPCLDAVNYGNSAFVIEKTTTTNVTIYWDEVTVALADSGQAYTAVPRTTYTPTFVGMGTVTSPDCAYQVLGSMLMLDCRFTTGTVTATTASLSLPTGFMTVTATNPKSVGCNQAGGTASSGGVYGGCTMTVLSPSSSNVLQFAFRDTSQQGLTAGTGTALFGSSTNYSVWAMVPIQGFGASQLVMADQANYGWTPYTPTFTGYGTVSGVDCQHMRNMEDVLIRCKFTSGTSTATEARASLPNGLISAGTDKIGSIQLAGTAVFASSGSATILIEPNVGYVTFGSLDSSGVGLTKKNANTIASVGTTMFYTARVPIKGWVANGNASLGPGMVLSGSTGNLKIEGANVNNTNGSQAINTSSSVGWINTQSCSSTGQCTYNISGTFSAAPWCTCSSNNTNANICEVYNITSTALTIRTGVSGATANENNTKILCLGNRN